MRKLVVLSAGLLALAAFAVMPTSKAMALEKAPAQPNCLDEDVTCFNEALQDLFCCAHPEARDCEPIKMAPSPDLVLRQESCAQQHRDEENSCDDDFVACLSGGLRRAQ
jgi:hypothetical protein